MMLAKNVRSIVARPGGNNISFLFIGEPHAGKAEWGTDAAKIARRSYWRLERKDELVKHYTNVQEVLLWSNATPIRSHDGVRYACCYCTESYPLPSELKRHNLTNHKHESLKQASFTKRDLYEFVVKMDITGLRCDICESSIETLERLLGHLNCEHSKCVHTDIDSHMLPFKFDDAQLRCYICSTEFGRFKALLEHMHSHYRNYVCIVCNQGFVNRRTLVMHENRHVVGHHPCSHCSKVFNTLPKKKSHERRSHTHVETANKCPYCDATFANYRQKVHHMATSHDVAPVLLNCHACGRTFKDQKSYTVHVKRYHLGEKRHECKLCDMKFFFTYELKEHVVKHTGVRNFECDLCHKTFTRRKTLKVHLRIHADDRRFKCEFCRKTFVHKVSWRSHLRSKHQEIA